MTSRERFLAACRCALVDRPPAWIMRQAGRYLPEYRALKEKFDFLELVRTPELAAQVSLQPISRFKNLDAAILFSDILTVPEALGQGYFFRDDGAGIAMEWRLDSEEKIARLGSGEDVPAKLDYMAQAMRLVRAELGRSRALLGFAGAPWTLAVYMVEGGSARNFTRIKALAAENPRAFELLMEKLCAGVATSLNMQISAGADAVQIFDSWAGICPARDYEFLSLRWIRRVVSALPASVPVIVFAKGMAHFAREIAGMRGSEENNLVVGVDWTQRLSDIRHVAGGNVALQGNLDPTLINFSDAKIVRFRTRDIVNEIWGENGFFFNLGLGILPEARVENVEAMLDEVALASAEKSRER